MNTIRYKSTDIAHQFLQNHITPGDICVDCTAGHGHDTLFLANRTGPAGFVYAFDVQEAAILSTQKKLAQAGYTDNIRFIHDSHENLATYIEQGQASCFIFNLGWLPGSDHIVKTTKESTIIALASVCNLLPPGGVISITLYSGKDLGFEEKEGVLRWTEKLVAPFTVLKTEYHNRRNHPPIHLFIIKQH